MAGKSEKSFLVYIILILVIITIFGGLIYWTLPLVLNQDAEQIPIVPPNSNPSKVVIPSVEATEEEGGEPEPIAQIVDRVGRSVVKITTVQRRTTYDFFLGQTQEQVTGEGSGVIFDPGGYILTNNHVVQGADQIFVLLTDSTGQEREVQGEVLGRDSLTDLAVVKIDSENLQVARFGDSDGIRVGDTAIAIGNPLGFANTVTVGVISALNRDLPIQEGTELLDLIQTDAAINPGNSGGALFNIHGEVVGINTAIIRGAQGLGFAIPTNIAREISRELIEKGSVTRPWIGIFGSTITPELRERARTPVERGVLVARVVSGSPADRSGMEEGDIIVRLNDERISSMEQLLKEMRRYQIGDQISFTVIRNGRERQISLELQERPVQERR